MNVPFSCFRIFGWELATDSYLWLVCLSVQTILDLPPSWTDRSHFAKRVSFCRERTEMALSYRPDIGQKK